MLTELWDKLKTAIADIATLDVVTATGTIDITNAFNDKDQVDFAKLMTALKTKPAPQTPQTPSVPGTQPAPTVSGAAALSVLAISHLEFDCDSFVFVKNNLNESEQALVRAHAEMVKAAQETRYGVVKMAIELFKGTPPAPGT